MGVENKQGEKMESFVCAVHEFLRYGNLRSSLSSSLSLPLLLSSSLNLPLSLPLSSPLPLPLLSLPCLSSGSSST